jgi:hypothetical protein
MLHEKLHCLHVIVLGSFVQWRALPCMRRAGKVTIVRGQRTQAVEPGTRERADSAPRCCRLASAPDSNSTLLAGKCPCAME